MKEITRAWLKKAEEDYLSAEGLLGLALYDTSCYHSQQASEKYLKSILCEHDEDIPKTHLLDKLIVLVESCGVKSGDDVKEACLLLTDFATLTRYPGYDATKEDAEKAIQLAKVIKGYVGVYFQENS